MFIKKSLLKFFTVNIFVFLVLFLSLSLSLFYSVEAEELTPEKPVSSLEKVVGASGLAGAERESAASIGQKIGTIIGYFLSFLGVVALILVIYGGFLWMTAGGSEEKIKKAKELLKDAAIGLVIILLSYLIVNTIMVNIYSKT